MDDNKEVVTALREIAAGKFQIDDSGVTGEERWLPSHRQSTPEEVDDRAAARGLGLPILPADGARGCPVTT
ncbi:MAG: DNA-directed RNA polymerase subunit omega [Myxococcota bacterium]